MFDFKALVACIPLLALGVACREPATPPAAEVDEASLVSVTLQVEGMVCEGCQSAIQDALAKVEGVHTCTASHEKKVAEVRYDPEKVDPGQLAKVINDLGYRAAPPGQPLPPPR